MTPGPGFARVALGVGVSADQLRYAMNDVGLRRGVLHVTISVTPARWSRQSVCRPDTVLWDVAELLRVEPEELRDVIAEVYHVNERGRTANLTHRVWRNQ